MSEKLQIAIEAAKKGAAEALKFFDTGISVTLKEDKTVVTKADYASEKAILDYITSQHADAKFVAEESGGNAEEENFWIVDPVDGTRSFSRGAPTWCVLIAYCVQKEIQLGVCYFPILDVLIYAEKGKGTFINNKRTYVSKIPSLKEAYIGFGSPKYFENKNIILDFVESTAGLRIPDLTFADYLVAKGSMDACIDAYGMLWDLAPFKVIIEEAGGKITRLDGSPWTLEGRGGIMSNGLVHDEILQIVNKK